MLIDSSTQANVDVTPEEPDHACEERGVEHTPYLTRRKLMRISQAAQTMVVTDPRNPLRDQVLLNLMVAADHAADVVEDQEDDSDDFVEHYEDDDPEDSYSLP